MEMGRLRVMRLVKSFCLLWLFAFAICAAQKQSPETQPPDTPAGHQCAAWLESFNRGDRDAHRDFLEEKFPVQGRQHRPGDGLPQDDGRLRLQES